MSIASDEAGDIYGNMAEFGSKFWRQIESGQEPKRKAYIAGRTAEPTDAEIEAAKTSVCAALCEKYNPARMVIKDGEQLRSIDADNRIAELSGGTRIQVERLVRLILEAARKVVSE